jgi:hypothetical protein
MHIGIEISGRFFDASIQIGRPHRGQKMVDWDGIAKQKAEARQLAVDERRARQEDRAAHEASLVDFLKRFSIHVKNAIEERNASIPLPGNKIQFHSLGPKGFQVNQKAAILRAEIEKRDEFDVVEINTSGIEPSGEKSSDRPTYFKLTPAGGEFVITRYSGRLHDEALTMADLVEEVLQTFAWYAS